MSIEPDLMYCPSCRDEYRAEIRTCVACGIDLINGVRMLELQAQDRQLRTERVAIAPDEQLVDLRKGPLAEMKRLKDVLERAAVPALLAGERQSCGQGCGGGKSCRGAELYLQVRLTDVREALAAIEADALRHGGIDDAKAAPPEAVYDTSRAEAVCPACGTRFPTSSAACPDCGLCFA